MIPYTMVESLNGTLGGALMVTVPTVPVVRWDEKVDHPRSRMALSYR